MSKNTASKMGSVQEAMATVKAWASDGLVVVPQRPTRTMVDAGAAMGVTPAMARRVFAAMIAAADEE